MDFAPLIISDRLQALTRAMDTGGEVQINNGASTLVMYSGGAISVTLATLVEA